jgi:anthranilate synthase component 1
MFQQINLSKFRSMHCRLELRSSPVAMYEALYEKDRFSFLYESLESLGKQGRYSFLGGNPFLLFKSKRLKTEITFSGKSFSISGNPIELLRKVMKSFDSPLPVSPFPGGALGYVAYDAIRHIEIIPDTNVDEMKTPDLYFLFPREIIIFDHQENTMDIIVHDDADPKQRMNILIKKIENSRPKRKKRPVPYIKSIKDLQSNSSKEAYISSVKKAKEYIYAGDIFQVVLSQRFTIPVQGDPFYVYQSLRRTNPSPYMYYLNLNGLAVLGSSPEILVKMDHTIAVSRPLAGTRPRGKNPSEDKQFETDLFNDAKERAEHIMLVDLARNDLGRVCELGSVRTTHLLEIERYSKVMHFVSHIEGKIHPHRDMFDLFMATFPAGTVSGAPKIRAMEIIEELEPSQRGIYAGGIGYFSFSGETDFCIAIRMIVIQNGMAAIQAGAGIVADSDPEREYQEILNKSRPLMTALRERACT